MQRWHQQSGHDCSGKNGKVRWSFLLSLSHKSKRWESPLHSPLLPIHSCISLFIVTFLPLSKQETKRKWRNEKDDVPTFRLEAVPLVPKLLSSSRRACEIHHEPRRARGREWEGGRTAIFAPFKDVCLACSLLLARESCKSRER